MNRIVYFVNESEYRHISPHETMSKGMTRMMYLSYKQTNPRIKALKTHFIKCSRLRIVRVNSSSYDLFAIKL